MLRARTVRFAQVPRTAAAIDAFARETTAIEPQERPFPQFHHCPFTGLIGKDLSRVGCLLHPMATGNNGVDFRGLSYYGGLACHSYFCPATHQVAPRHKKILRALIDDWHLYGLVVTESDLLMALFQEIERRLGRKIHLEAFYQYPEAVQPLMDLLRLKIDWPHRPPEADTPCHYFFFDLVHERPTVAYARLGVAVSRFEVILRELVSLFDSAADLRRAEERIEAGIEAVVGVFREGTEGQERD